MLYRLASVERKCRNLNMRSLYKNFSLSAFHQPFEYISSSAFSPVTIFAHSFEILHQYSGLSWPFVILGFTVGMRSLLFPLHIQQTKSTITASNLKNELSSFQSRIQAFRSNNQLSEASLELQQMYLFMRKNNCHPIRTIVLSCIPIPFFMSTFFALRNMAKQPINSFLEGGCGWLTDLTVSDPFYVLPLLSGLSLLASFEVSKKLNPVAMPEKMITIMRMLGVLSIPFISFLPSALCMYFITTNLFTLIQNLFLCNPKIRKILNIPTLLTHTDRTVNLNEGSDFLKKFKNLFQQNISKNRNSIIIHSSKPVVSYNTRNE